jgi:hypothetical protein
VTLISCHLKKSPIRLLRPQKTLIARNFLEAIRWLALICLGHNTNSLPARHAVTNALLDSDRMIRNQAYQILSGELSE